MGLPRSTFYDTPDDRSATRLVAKIVNICDEFELMAIGVSAPNCATGHCRKRQEDPPAHAREWAETKARRRYVITTNSDHEVRFSPISPATTTAISSRPATIAGASRVELAITRQPALAPSPQPRAAPTGQALIARKIGRGGPYSGCRSGVPIGRRLTPQARRFAGRASGPSLGA